MPLPRWLYLITFPSPGKIWPQPSAPPACVQISHTQEASCYSLHSVMLMGKIHSLTFFIMDYINFCMENARCFSNTKPWITPDMKALR